MAFNYPQYPSLAFLQDNQNLKKKKKCEIGNATTKKRVRLNCGQYPGHN